MAVQNPFFTVFQWIPGPAPRTFKLQIQAELINDFVANGLTVNFTQTCVRATLKKVPAAGSEITINSNIMMNHSGNGIYDSILVTVMEPTIAAGTVLKAYISVDPWVFNKIELNAANVEGTVPAPPA